jgi:hypothetical protein
MSAGITHDLGTQLATFLARNPTPKSTDPHLLTFIKQFLVLSEERGRSKRSAPQLPPYPQDWVVDISALRRALRTFAADNADSIALIAAADESQSAQPSVETTSTHVSDTPATPQETVLATSHAPDAQRTVIRVAHPRPLVL